MAKSTKALLTGRIQKCKDQSLHRSHRACNTLKGQGLLNNFWVQIGLLTIAATILIGLQRAR
jgi:hypothetical protein